MKKVFSLVLALTMIASLFAGLAVVNVSAHQNYSMETITFDETDSNNSTGYKYGTGNIDVAEGGTYKNISSVNYGAGTFSGGLSSTKYTYVDVKTAPDDRYGKSLYYYEWYEDGANKPYVQAPVVANVVKDSADQGLTGTVKMTASLYTEKNTADIYCQRAIKLRTTTQNGYKESFPVLFSHEASKGISVFGKASGKSFKADTWYDMDITYNTENSQYHVIVFEDGEEYINMMGTSATPLKNIGTMYLYHSTQDASRNHLKIYWDNVSINSADKFEISEDDAYPVMDFENLKDQEAGKASAEGLPSTYSYSFGYQGNPELTVFKALETDKGTSACVFGPAYPGASNTNIVLNRYRYAQMSFRPSALPQFHLKTSVKFKNTFLSGIYLNDQGASEIMFYGGIKAFGQTLFDSYDTTGNVWYDIDLIMDTETGFYDLTIVKTDDNTTKRITGFQTKYTTPITAVKFGHDRGGETAKTLVNESFFWIDNLYLGNYGVDDVDSDYTVDFEDGIYSSNYSLKYTGIPMENLTATTGELGDVNIDFDTADTSAEGFNPDAVDSFAIPFIDDKPGYTITAKFKLEDLNSDKYVYFGNLPILQILTTGQVKCNQSARPITEGYLIVGNEYTITHTMQPGCSNSSTYVTGVMNVNGTEKESKAGYGQGRPSGPWDPFKIVVKPTGVADTLSTLTLSDILVDVKYATANSKNFKIESLENAQPETSIFLPHDKAGSGYLYTAELVFADFNTDREIKIGDNVIATIDQTGTLTLGDEMATLEEGITYKLSIDATHGETSTAVVTLGVASATVAASPYISFTQTKGASLMTLDNVHYVAKIPFEITSSEVINDHNVDEDVQVSFSTALADTVTKENIKIYKPAGLLNDTVLVADYDVTFAEDRKSIAISFDKEKSAHYHIAIEATDIFGAALSDYVEVNTELLTQIADPIKFTDAQGTVLTTLASGEITASTKISSGDGEAYGANMWIALYDQNKNLKQIKLTPVEFGATETEVKASVNVPDDGKAYFVKAGIVMPNLRPIVFGKIHTQVIILRLDDLKVGTVDTYSSLASWADEEDVDLSIGMVCNSIDEENDAYIQAVKDMVNTGNVEIWCHGYDHSYHEGTGATAEFYQQTPEYQAEILEKCYDHVYEKTDGVLKLSCLGTPSGAMDEDTFRALEIVPEFVVNFGSASVPYDGDGFMNLTNSLWMEPSTGKLNTLDTLKGFYDNRTVGKEYMIFGCHAGYFSDEDIQTLKDFAEYLKTKDLAFMTPTEYYYFVN
ncbi:MAG: DUF2334 domain-containing protein [Clostridia bacterium]|nr:DUF2334 domain-containing protein [Clostridia bacterium]